MLAKVLIGLAIIGVMSLFPIYLFVKSLSDRDETFQVRRVVALDDGNRLFIQRTGNAKSERNWSRVMLVGPQGNVLDEVVDEGGRDTMYYGRAPEGAWLENSSRGLHVRNTSDIQAVTVIASAKEHGVLARGYSVVGMLEKRLVVQGKDRRLYAVDVSRPIEQLPKDSKYSALAHHSKQFLDYDPVGVKSVSHIDGKRFDFDKLDLVDPKVVINPETHDAQMFAAPSGFLALSVDIVGTGGNHRLSRVSSTGEIAWTANTEALIGETKLDGKPAFRVAWAWIAGDTVHTVVEGDIYESSGGYSSAGGFGRYDARLVDLDAATGTVKGRWELTRKK